MLQKAVSSRIDEFETEETYKIVVWQSIGKVFLPAATDDNECAQSTHFRMTSKHGLNIYYNIYSSHREWK